MSGHASGADVTIVGGGLAGLAAASLLCENGLRVELFEARRRLGGRAGSFEDHHAGDETTATGEAWIDHCQHVGMGCCRAWLDFCRRTRIAARLRRDRTIRFVEPDGRVSVLRGAAWLPAPLHLLPSLMRLRFLSCRERVRLVWGAWQLARTPEAAAEQGTAAEWLRRAKQPPALVERFWSPVLVSALSESLDRISAAAAKQVIVEGLLARADAYHLLVPTAPLAQLYDVEVAGWLRRRGAALHLGRLVRRIHGRGDKIEEIEFTDGRRSVKNLLMAVPWRQLPRLIEPPLADALPWLEGLERIEASPITSVHLWFDRPILNWPHAALVGRLSQWIFARPAAEDGGAAASAQREHYYQVVISASRSLAGRPRAAILREVLDDLAAAFPGAGAACLLRWKVLTQHEAVFAATPGVERLRPPQQTAIGNLFVAGDWTRTGWPATMEGAVRSGYLAAAALLGKECPADEAPCLREIPAAVLTRLLMRR